MRLTSKVALTLTALAAVLGAGSSPAAPAGPHAVFYEVVENLTEESPHRVSHWAAQGTAAVGSPFCPTELIQALLRRRLISRTPDSCVITAFGMDDIDLATGTGEVTVLDFATVINGDNVVDGPERVVLTGTLAARLTLVPFGPLGVVPDIRGRSSTIGPAVPLIRVTDGVFTPDPFFGIQLPPVNFSGTFRLPFKVEDGGRLQRPTRDHPAYYLGDDGRLIEVQPDEFTFGFPMLRAEVTFE
jgi:hypothetical protein